MLKRGQVSHITNVALLFASLLMWRVILILIYPEQNEYANLVWAASYQLVALYGAILGFTVSKSWGGMKSVMGRSILFFVLGLLFQVGGQTVFSFYNLVFKIEIPYPSVADVFYFGSIPFYIYACFLLGKAAGNLTALKSLWHKAWALFLPAVLLIFSYEFFLSNYVFDFSQPLKTFLDFGYPFGQVIYLSVALLTYTLSKKVLGGVMKNKVLFILIALCTQYLADYNFLYQAQAGTWTNGGYGDFIYLVAYFMMAVGLINLAPDFVHASGNQKE